jgi:hypothetical protein
MHFKSTSFHTVIHLHHLIVRKHEASKQASMLHKSEWYEKQKYEMIFKKLGEHENNCEMTEIYSACKSWASEWQLI